MNTFHRAVVALMLPVLLCAAPAAAQGIQTGEISGTVSSDDGLRLPGARVTARGPELQGE